MPKKKEKPEVLTESQIEKTFEIKKGFNITDKETGKETRFDVGVRKPRFVEEKDFAPDVWQDLLSTGAVVPVEEPLSEEDEVVIVIKDGE